MTWQAVLIIGHIIGTSLGVGGATASDFMFFRAIKDGKIDATELGFLNTVSNVVWAGFLILIFSGFGFLLSYRLVASEMGQIYTTTLWAKLIVVGVIFFNGLLMHWKVFPLIESRLGKPLFCPEVIKNAHIMFTTGAISIISWYTALILGTWQSLTLEYPFFTIFVVYLGIILVGVLVSNIIGKLLIRRLTSK